MVKAFKKFIVWFFRIKHTDVFIPLEAYVNKIEIVKPEPIEVISTLEYDPYLEAQIGKRYIEVIKGDMIKNLTQELIKQNLIEFVEIKNFSPYFKNNKIKAILRIVKNENKK